MWQVEQKEWWERNWKWSLPIGCLGALIVLTAFVVTILAVIFGIIKYSDVYTTSLAQAQAHPAVVEALGSPVKEGFFVFGSIHVTGPTGEADLAIPISGPEGSGTIYVVATKSAGRWQFTILEAEIKGFEERIDLLGNR